MQTSGYARQPDRFAVPDQHDGFAVLQRGSDHACATIVDDALRKRATRGRQLTSRSTSRLVTLHPIENCYV